MGARSAGNPHAACDVEGTGNVARSSGLPARQSSTLPMSGDGKRSVAEMAQATAPILDSALSDVTVSADHVCSKGARRISPLRVSTSENAE